MRKILLIIAIGLMLSGCGAYRCYTLIREKPTDIVSVDKKGFPGLTKDRDIKGKGFDVWASRQVKIKAEYDKEGKIKKIEISFQKASILERFAGFWTIMKPDNVEVIGAK